MALLLSDAQAAQSANLTQSYKTTANREAAKIAALIALYYRSRVNVEDPESVEAWLALMIPRLIAFSDAGADRAALYFNTLRQLETGLADFRAEPSYGTVDPGVRKSLLSVGPFDYMNKAAEIRNLDVGPQQEKALLLDAKQVTAKKLAAAAVRHAQAGGRQTVHDNSALDKTALGWVRVTRPEPCAFCAMLASRGIHYRSFKEGSFAASDAQFTGTGDAKVHDQCGCSLKPVYAKNDPILGLNKKFADQWTLWGAGGGDALTRFRRGYDHWRETGENLTWEQANAA